MNDMHDNHGRMPVTKRAKAVAEDALMTAEPKGAFGALAGTASDKGDIIEPYRLIHPRPVLRFPQ